MKLISILLFCVTLTSFSQNIKTHQWKNRVLLIITDDKKRDDFTNQVKLLEKQLSDLWERKLVIYKITPSEYAVNIDKDWILSPQLYLEFNNEKSSFKVILIGLDGGIKLAQTTVLSTKKLFSIIDGMPMRKRELKTGN